MPERRRSPPSRLNEVRRRARRIMQQDGVGYHAAMKEAGWRVAKAAGGPRP